MYVSQITFIIFHFGHIVVFAYSYRETISHQLNKVTMLYRRPAVCFDYWAVIFRQLKCVQYSYDFNLILYA
jgi:hypothetical protein